MTRRRAVETTCPMCWADLLVGLDGDAVALDAIADAAGLTRAGELLAILSGRTTYEVDARGALHRRDRWSIRSPRLRVVATHRCWEPMPADWMTRPTPPRRQQTQEVPF